MGAAMNDAIDTTKVIDRRELHFQTIEDIQADVERLARAKEIRALGNWSPGQIFGHLAITMNSSIDGFKHHLFAPLRWFIRLFVKRKLLKGPMTPGFKLNDKAAEDMVPPPTSLEDGLRSIREAIRRLQTETKRAPSAFMGHMTDEEWTQLHCRHAELHLSFLVPVE
jgi:hypothetical protein